MKRCVNCGKIVREEAKFCPDCGHSEFIQYNPDKTVSLSGKEEEKKTDNTQDSQKPRTEYRKSVDYNYGSNADFEDHEKASGNADTQKEEQREAAKKKKWGIRVAVVVAGCLMGAFLAGVMSVVNESVPYDFASEQETDTDEETITEYSVTEDAAYNTDGTITDETDDEDKESVLDSPPLEHGTYRVNTNDNGILFSLQYDIYYVNVTGYYYYYYSALNSALKRWCTDQFLEAYDYKNKVNLPEDYDIETYGSITVVRLRLSMSPFMQIAM